jgi:hypothetical protein
MSTDGPRAGTWQGGAGEGERWLPILEVTGAVFSGLSAAHAWVVGTSRGVTLLEAAPAAALLPLLELTPDVVRARIGEALEAARLGRRRRGRLSATGVRRRRPRQPVDMVGRQGPRLGRGAAPDRRDRRRRARDGHRAMGLAGGAAPGPPSRDRTAVIMPVRRAKREGRRSW